MRSSNPALSEATFEKFANAGHFEDTQAGVMTVNGAARKTFILLAIALATAAFTWTQVIAGNMALAFPLAIGGAIGGLILSIVLAFRPQSAPITAPLYAALEGLFLGAISALFNREYNGIVGQAILLTFGTLGVMLMAYQSGLIRATEKFKLGVVAATGAIALLYLVNLVMRMFGATQLSQFLWSSSPLSIGISVVIVGVAALNLVLDFDFIEEGAKHRLPKFMEWYGAYGLMVTLVWLYLELLRLLSKLQRR